MTRWRPDLMLQHDFTPLASGLQQGEHDLDVRLGPTATMERRLSGPDPSDHVLEHLAAARHRGAAGEPQFALAVLVVDQNAVRRSAHLAALAGDDHQAEMRLVA